MCLLVLLFNWATTETALALEDAQLLYHLNTLKLVTLGEAGGPKWLWCGSRAADVLQICWEQML